MKKVGVVIGGWDAPGLNAVTHAIVKALPDCEVLGFIWSFDAVIDSEYITLTRDVTAPVRWIWGTILKTRNKGRFWVAAGAGDEVYLPQNLIDELKAWYDKLGLECLFVLWWDSTISTSRLFQENGINIIGIPKTIDNDLASTEYTYGFQTAIETVNDALQKLHTTATSHDRVMVVEVMGRHAWWIPLYSWIAWGASIILLPEMPFSYDNIIKILEERREMGKNSTIIVVAEWAHENQTWMITKDDWSSASYQSLWWIWEQLTAYINKNSDFEARNNQLWHIQRWWSPSGMDMVLSLQYGSYAARMFRNQEFGRMVVCNNSEMSSMTIKEWTALLKNVTKDSQLYQLACEMGISFWF